MFNAELGSLQALDGRNIFVTHKGRSGIAVYGPYSELGPGRYIAECAVSAGSCDTVGGKIEVVVDYGAIILNWSYIYSWRLNTTEGRIFLPFQLDRTGLVEVRVHSFGLTNLYIDIHREIYRLDDNEPNFSPVLAPGANSRNHFFREHSAKFRVLYESGACISVDENGTICTLNGVSFFLRNEEEFQVAEEIFLANVYTVRSAKPKIMIDIGMNVGLASLHLASDPTVMEVHSFEPFSAPFNRALENIALNPALAAKITPHHFGLAGEDKEIEVNVDNTLTIGTSIRGRSTGRLETIKLCDAATALRGIFERAAKTGADVFIKVDCEGSEFAIFESFTRHDLFRSIRGFMVEWHKWWSADKTRADLLEPLLANGFVIFDQTNPVDKLVGGFTAVRVS